MSIVSEAKRLVESTFDIPFSVILSKQEEPLFTIAPLDSHGHLFDLKVCFRNNIRLEMEFTPQPYAAEMVHGMGIVSNAKKDIFSAFTKQMNQKGARITFRINDLIQNPNDYSSWPENWEKVSIKTDIRPIEFDQFERPDYERTLEKWLPLMMGLSLSLLNVVDEEDETVVTVGEIEGKKYEVTTTRYERSPINRTLCLAHFGYSCAVCGFNFEKTYGKVGKEYIQVHHKVPVSRMKDGYQVDPINDLVPVCPNCHAMLHRKDPPIDIDVLKQMIFEEKEK